MLARPVEAHLPGELDVSSQVVVGGCGEEPVGEVALIQDEPLVAGTVVQENLAVSGFDLAHPEIALYGVQGLTPAIEELEPQVVEVRVLGCPEGGPLAQVRRFGCRTARQERQA